MKGNFHVRFLEGGGLATARLYSAVPARPPQALGSHLGAWRVEVERLERRSAFAARTLCALTLHALTSIADAPEVGRLFLHECLGMCRLASLGHSRGSTA